VQKLAVVVTVVPATRTPVPKSVTDTITELADVKQLPSTFTPAGQALYEVAVTVAIHGTFSSIVGRGEVGGGGVDANAGTAPVKGRDVLPAIATAISMRAPRAPMWNMRDNLLKIIATERGRSTTSML
jgi:hypothetical protein